MRNQRRIAIALFSSLILSGGSFLTGKPAIADSPLTSTDLAGAYEDLLEVRVARHWKRAEGVILNFLLGNSPIDQKIAVVNALGWDIDRQKNSALFVRGVAQRENIPLRSVKLESMTPDDWIVLGYLLAMDNYQDMRSLGTHFEAADQLSPDLQKVVPEDLLSRAILDDQTNFSAQFVASLVEAQLSFYRSWCDVYLEPALVLGRFPTKDRNMRAQAVDDAMEYIKLYQPYCNS